MLTIQCVVASCIVLHNWCLDMREPEVVITHAELQRLRRDRRDEGGRLPEEQDEEPDEYFPVPGVRNILRTGPDVRRQIADALVAGGL
jgi:hypothetical protein